jgi:hypothetical protein
MGLKRAKRLGEVGARGGGTDSAPRIGTPEPFRDLLLSIARTARESRHSPNGRNRSCGFGAKPEWRGAAEERHSPNLSDHPPGSSPTDTTGDDVLISSSHGASNG